MCLGLTVPAACGAPDLVGPELPAAVEQRGPALVVGPTHEIRIFVDAEGTPVGLEAARIRSFAVPQFRAKATTRGTRLPTVPEKARSMVTALASKSDLVTVAVYRDRGNRAGFGEATQSSSPDDPPIESPIVWIENPEAFPPAEHEAFVDEAINGLIALGDSYLAEVPTDLLETDYLRDQHAHLRTSMLAGELFASRAASVPEEEGDGPCNAKKVLVAGAVAGVVAAVAGGVAGIAAAAAPTAFVLGNITGMVLPAASTVIAAKVAAYATAAAAGIGLGAAVAELRACLSSR